MGPDLWNRTYYPTQEDANTVKKPWYVVDAEGQTLGRLSVLVADHIRWGDFPCRILRAKATLEMPVVEGALPVSCPAYTGCLCKFSLAQRSRLRAFHTLKSVEGSKSALANVGIPSARCIL